MGVPNMIIMVPLAKTGLARMVCLDHAVRLALAVHLVLVVRLALGARLARRAFLETAAAMAVVRTVSLEVPQNSDNKHKISVISYSNGYSNSVNRDSNS